MSLDPADRPAGLIVPLDHPLDPEQHGSKAARLAHGLALGARVPPSVVIPAAVHREALAQTTGEQSPRVSPQLVEALREALPALSAPPWVVRTSAPAEDLPGASAAGLYRSELGLGDVDAVVHAVQRCWREARAERITVYLKATGASGAAGGEATAPPVAILIQGQVRARWAGVLFTRDPRRGPTDQGLRCELARASTTAVTAGLVNPVVHALHRRGSCVPPLPTDAGTTADDLLALAEQAERVAGGPADVELALTDTGPTLLQLRPITAYDVASAGPADQIPGDDDNDLVWRWDAEHNPAPLSTLHASLVERLDRIPSLPFRMRCIGGYLYSAVRPGVPAAPEETPEETRRAWPARKRELEQQLQVLEGLEAAGEPSNGEPLLAAVLAGFEHFYERYAALAGAPLASSHRRFAARVDKQMTRGTLTWEGLGEALGGVHSPLSAALRGLARIAADHPGLLAALSEGRDVAQLSGGADLEQGLARAMQRLGALPPVWDLAVPTLAESPATLRRSIALLAGQQRAAAPAMVPDDNPYLHNLAADEQDDLLFARGLAVLRRVCLAAGAQLSHADRLDCAQDVFRLELDPLLLALRGVGPDPRNLLAPEDPASTETHDAPGPWRGFGTGSGIVRARALVVRRLEDNLEALATAAVGRIVVCPSLLPSAFVLLAAASGIVTDHGGLLSHGAILARELGLPAVLGTRTATASLRTDDPLWLDAEQGLVIRL